MITPAFPARWFYGLYVISPVNLADCHRHRRDARHHRQLGAEPLGRQDHTISPSASVPFVTRHIRVHRIPASRVVTSAIRPSEDRGGMTRWNTDFQNFASGIFLRADLERAGAFDSAEQISILAHVKLPDESACEFVCQAQSGPCCPDGRIRASVGLGLQETMSALPL